MWNVLKLIGQIATHPYAKNRQEAREYLSRLHWGFAESKDATANLLSDNAMAYLFDSTYGVEEDVKTVIRTFMEIGIEGKELPDAVKLIDGVLLHMMDYEGVPKDEQEARLAMVIELREMLIDHFGRYIRPELAKSDAGEPVGAEFDILIEDIPATLGESGRWIEAEKVKLGLEPSSEEKT